MKIRSTRTNDSLGQLDLRFLYPSATHTETYSYRKRQEDRALRGLVRISNVRTMLFRQAFNPPAKYGWLRPIDVSFLQ